MAKKEKVVDLKPTNITEDQLKQIQEVVAPINNIQMELGRMATRRHTMCHEVSELQKMLTEIQVVLEKEYGKVNINMHYAVGQEVYGGHTICDILEEDDKFSVYIKKGKNVLPWKDFNKNMAVSVEYNLQY